MAGRKGIVGSILAVIITASFTGCAPVFPRDMLEKVDRTISFRDLRSDPDRYAGKWVMFAGMIVDSKNAKEGTYIEVLHRPASGSGRPLQSDETEGRFIIFSEQYLDTAVYHRGRDITVVGEAAGKKTMPLGEIEYQYPVINPRALRLWEPYSGPSFHFGIGVFHRI